MSDKTTISFETVGPRADERFVREYVLPAMDRRPALDSCDDVGSLRYGHDPHIDHGEVRLHFLADQQAQSAENEIDAYTEGIRNRLFALGDRYGNDRASARIDNLIDSLEETRDQVKAITDD